MDAIDTFLDEPIESAPSNYETPLTPVEEADFQKWKSIHAPKDSGRDYDLRGAFKAGLKPAGPEAGIDEGHWPDTFKKPTHPTFSDQSKYAVGENAAKAGRWDGDTFIPPEAPKTDPIDAFLDAPDPRAPKTDDVDAFLDAPRLTAEQIDKMTPAEIEAENLKDAKLSQSLLPKPKLSAREEIIAEQEGETMAKDWTGLSETIKRYTPFVGASEAGEEGIRSGMELLGPGVAGQTVGVGLGAMNIVGTAFNPLMAAGQDVAKTAQATGQVAAGDYASALRTMEGLEEVLPDLKPAMTEDWKKNFLSDLYVQLRKDPVNSMLVVDGLGKLGSAGYAARAGRLGEPLNPVVAKYFPETVDVHAKADVNRINKILKAREVPEMTAADVPVLDPKAGPLKVNFERSETPVVPVAEQPSLKARPPESSGLDFKAAQDADIQALVPKEDAVIVPGEVRTVKSQIDLLTSGEKPAVLLTPGSIDMPTPAGFERTETAAGVFFHDPDMLTATDIRQAVAEDRLGDVLGYGISRKPKPGQEIGAVVVRGPDGVEKQSVVTDQSNLQSTMSAARKILKEGDTVALERPEKIIGERQAALSKPMATDTGTRGAPQSMGDFVRMNGGIGIFPAKGEIPHVAVGEILNAFDVPHQLGKARADKFGASVNAIQLRQRSKGMSRLYGKSPDAMAELLHEAGYLKERDINEMVEKLTQEATGKKQYLLDEVAPAEGKTFSAGDLGRQQVDSQGVPVKVTQAGDRPKGRQYVAGVEDPNLGVRSQYFDVQQGKRGKVLLKDNPSVEIKPGAVVGLEHIPESEKAPVDIGETAPYVEPNASRQSNSPAGTNPVLLNREGNLPGRRLAADGIGQVPELELRRALRSFGPEVSLETTSGHQRSSAFPTSDGKIIVRLNPELLKQKAWETVNKPGAKNKEAAALRLLHDQAREELIHASMLSAWRDEWVSRGGKGDFVRFAEAKSRLIFGDITQTIYDLENGGNRSGAMKIRQALFDSWNIYFGDPELKFGAKEWSEQRLREKHPLDTKAKAMAEEFAQVHSPKDLMRMLQDNPDVTHSLLGEFTRQLVEIKDRGLTADVGFRKIMGQLMQWVEDALFRLRRAAKDVEAGEYGEMLKTTIHQMEETLKKADQQGFETLETTRPDGDLFNVPRPTMEGLRRNMESEKAQRQLESGKPRKDTGTKEIFPEGEAKNQGEFFTRETSRESTRTTPEAMLKGLASETSIEGILPRTLKLGRVLRQSAVDVLAKAGGRYKDLSNRIKDYYDDRDSLMGQLGTPFQKILDDMKRDERKTALDEFEAFMKTREGGRRRVDEATLFNAKGRQAALESIKKSNADANTLYNSMTPGGRALVDQTKTLFKQTGEINQKLGVKNRNPITGEIRDIGNLGEDYFPRILNKEVREILQNPKKYPEAYQELLQKIADDKGLISKERAEQFLHSSKSVETSNDHLANLELARVGDLPADFYEHRFEKVVPGFIGRWSDRISQIKQFGQKIGESRLDIFDKVLERTTDKETRDYIQLLRDRIYDKKTVTSAHRFFNFLRGYTTMTKLSSVWSSLRNTSSIFTNTVPEFGIVPALTEGMRTLRHFGEKVRETQYSGALKTDLVSAMADLWDLSETQQKMTDAALTASGFNLVEKFNRTHAAMTAKQWARWAVEKIETAPESKAAALAKVKFEKYGIDWQALRDEGFEGPVSRKLMREGAMNTQFNYDLRQVPLWAESPAAKFLFQFQKFSLQQLRRFTDETVKPAVFGHKVDGKTVRDYRPLLYTLAAAVGTGEGLMALRSALFGKDRNDAGLTEIANAADDRPDRALTLLLQRVAHDIIYAGAWGAMGDWAANIEAFAQRGRAKSPIDPPGLGPLKNAWDNLVTTAFEQKTLTAHDFKVWAKNEIPLLNYAEGLWKNASGDDLYDAQRKARRIKQLGYRYAVENGMPIGGSVDFAKNPNTPIYRDIQAALMVGDKKEAQSLIKDFIGNAQGDARRRKLMALKASIRSRRPMKAGAIDTQEERTDFKKWVSSRVGAEDLKTLTDVDDTYMKTAAQLGLVGTSQ